MLSKTFKLLLAFVVLIGVGHLYYAYTGNFRSKYVLAAGPHTLSTEQPELEAEEENISHLLEQPFRYAGHGHQTYVFIGDDGQTVLKLFMKDYIRSDWFRYLFPPLPPLRQWMLHKGEKRQFRRQRLLNGYANCYALDKKNCGLLYLHIDQTLSNSVLHVIDALGIEHEIPAGQVVFALQKRATATKEVLRAYLSRGDMEGASAAVGQILNLYRDQFEKGLVDRDRNFLENTGFADGRAIRTDAGKVVINDGRYSLEYEYAKIIDSRLAHWLNRYFPDAKLKL